MRLKKLFLLDMRFQAKYGFYFLYVVLTVIYIAALFALPENWKEKAAAILRQLFSSIIIPVQPSRSYKKDE